MSSAETPKTRPELHASLVGVMVSVMLACNADDDAPQDETSSWEVTAWTWPSHGATMGTGTTDATGTTEPLPTGSGDTGGASHASTSGGTTTMTAATDTFESTMGASTDESSPGTSGGVGTGDGSEDGGSSSTGGEPESRLWLRDDVYSLQAGQPLRVDALTGLLANDTDLDGQALVVTSLSVRTTTGVELVLDPGGAFEYPAQDVAWWGSDVFTYTVSNEAGDTGSARVRLIQNPTRIQPASPSPNLLRLDGEDERLEAGRAVNGAGDVNGDGYDDVLVGAPSASFSQPYAGRTYVVFGGPRDSTASLSQVGEGVGGFVIDGEYQGGRSGAAVAGAGDVNGDGLDDVIIGAPAASGPQGTSEGCAYVVFGKTSSEAVSLADVAAGDGGYLVGCEGLLTEYGYSVGGAGDVDGDGLDDVVVGRPGTFTGGGIAYIVYGLRSGGPGRSNWFVGAGPCCDQVMQYSSDLTGFSVSGAGDLNADGFADVVIGAPRTFHQWSGSVYAVLGGAPTTQTRITMGYSANGYSVSRAGDFNGDGFSDVVSGAPHESESNVFFGHAPFVSGGSYDTPVPRIQIRTPPALGCSEKVGGGGDINGDGFDDVVVGCANSVDRTLSGHAYVVFGRSSLEEVNLVNDPFGTGGFSIDGAVSHDQFAQSLGHAGDFDGDGFADIIVGAPGAGNNGASSGRAYIIFGDEFGAPAHARGGEGDDELFGTADAEVLVGGDGDDILEGRGGADVLYGGRGDDVFVVEDSNFARIHGGCGRDTLHAAAANVTLDLTPHTLETLRGIEVIDLTIAGANELRIDGRNLLYALSAARTWTIRGNEDDAVTIELPVGHAFAQTEIDGLAAISDGVRTVYLSGAMSVAITEAQ